MRPERIEAAVREAERFLDRVQTFRMEYKRLQDPKDWNESSLNMWWTGRHKGAITRASMDLTRALAELRKP